MLRQEKEYDFRKSMCSPHKRIYRDKSVKASENEFSLDKQIKIALISDNVTAKLAAKDFIAYLKTAFGIKATLTADENGADITAKVQKGELGDGEGYMGYKRTTSADGITIHAFDERGIAQAFYGMEEDLNAKGHPYLPYGDVAKRPAYSPRMIHSGYGLDEYPDEYLSVCAHHGYDAIIIFVKDAEHSAHGPCDFNDIVKRAARYGIDVYAYSYLKNFVHPEAEGAKEIFADVYGGIFKAIKGLKGMIFVGESIEFPSRDPKVVPLARTMLPSDGIPDSRITPGWWPCNDYPEWISLVRDSIRAVKPDADVVFWTYNFGWVDAKYRCELIRNLPTDISLLVTFEMFEKYPLGDANMMICDYTASSVGPGKYFLSEAEVAKERGIRLYSMVNTAGRTWDYGVAPYEPFPYQWNKRYEKINECREKYGLCGLMESHHFGFTPSFITMLAKNAYTIGGKSFDERMDEIARSFSHSEPEKVKDALKLWSEAITHYNASDENQYGPFRIGPAYPLCLKKQLKFPNKPGTHFGNLIYYVGRDLVAYDHGMQTALSIRIREEIKQSVIMKKIYADGLKILKSIKNKNNELLRLINLGEFLVKCHITAINAKKMYIETGKLLTASNNEQIKSAISRIEKIGKAEIENAKATIPIVRKDSAIGYEPSMLYQCSEENLLWKIKQVNYMLSTELDYYREAIKY